MTKKSKQNSDVQLEAIDSMTKGLDVPSLKRSFLEHVKFSLSKDRFSVTSYDKYLALAKTIYDRLTDRWITTQQSYYNNDVKRVYYLSMEFLVGRALGNAIINLDIEKEVREAIEELGFNLEELEEMELEPGLGNGGLGRLAACFLDSMATLNIPAYGMGIRYVYGIFNQHIFNGFQVEQPDSWLRLPNPWEIARPERTEVIKFYGRVQSFTDKTGRLVFNWTDTQDVLAMPYDTPVPGYATETCNTLRLWSAQSNDELDLKGFNQGDYMGACESKVLAENITKVLYPNDNFFEGKELRLKQQHFFVSASLQDILRRFKTARHPFQDFPNKVAIQLNDTHPAIAIPEMMRLLMDQEGLGWDESWEIVTNTFAYTNHTLLPEALEKWPVKFFQSLLPRHLQIIHEINRRFLEMVNQRFPGDGHLLNRCSIIEDGAEPQIRMAYLSVVGSHAVNGVAAIHSRLLKETVLRDFAIIFPNKFQNKTNGITQRRWLKKANPLLSQLITENLGKKWVTHLHELRGLEKYLAHEPFLKEWQRIKSTNKMVLGDYIQAEHETEVNLHSIFDVQVKRLHEYKRQLLNVLYIIHRYLKIKANPRLPVVERTCIFGAKAAPGYHKAKLIIKLINAVGEVINSDPQVGAKLKVFFLGNYRVSLAEKIMPAADLSQQISTAGMEASGTGNMKFALNGAVTIGTLDGANIEILEEVGPENMFVFGLNAAEVVDLKRRYNPREWLERQPDLQRVIELLAADYFSPDSPGLFKPIIDSLLDRDEYLVFADFASYVEAQNQVDIAWRDTPRWTRMSIINTARSGRFSSDRSIGEYARDIWGLKGH